MPLFQLYKVLQFFGKIFLNNYYKYCDWGQYFLYNTALFRLKKTWGLLSRRDKQLFDKLHELFSDDSNFEKLRKHLDLLALGQDGCIPYLGLYLTDLIHIGKYN